MRTALVCFSRTRPSQPQDKRGTDIGYSYIMVFFKVCCFPLSYNKIDDIHGRGHWRGLFGALGIQIVAHLVAGALGGVGTRPHGAVGVHQNGLRQRHGREAQWVYFGHEGRVCRSVFRAHINALQQRHSAPLEKEKLMLGFDHATFESKRTSLFRSASLFDLSLRASCVVFICICYVT